MDATLAAMNDAGAERGGACVPAAGLRDIGIGLRVPRPGFANTQRLVRVTSGEHPWFGRIVLDAPGLPYTVSRDGNHVLIFFSGDAVLGELPPTPRNVLAIRPVPGGVELTVPPGANVRTTRLGDKVVVDIDDTVPNRPPVPLTPAGTPLTNARSSRGQKPPAQPPAPTQCRERRYRRGPERRLQAKSRPTARLPAARPQPAPAPRMRGKRSRPSMHRRRPADA